MSVAVKYFLIYLCESAWPTMSDVFPGKVDLDETKKRKLKETGRATK